MATLVEGPLTRQVAKGQIAKNVAIQVAMHGVSCQEEGKLPDTRY